MHTNQSCWSNGSEDRSIVVWVDHVNAKAKVLDMARATRWRHQEGRRGVPFSPHYYGIANGGQLPCFHPLMPYLN